MLKSNNFDSVMDDLPPLGVFEHLDFELESTTLPPLAAIEESHQNLIDEQESMESSGCETSLASLQLTAGILQLYAPPMAKAKAQLKELIQKQNKIYIDLSREKFKLDNNEMDKLQDMMNNVKLYREKLLKVKKQMQNIYQRTKVLKKRAINIQTCKEKDLQRKLHKQQQEESLIGKQ